MSTKLTKAEYKELHNKVLETCRNNSAAFTQYVYGYENSTFHTEWHRFIDTHDVGIILAARGLGKSEQVSVSRVSWEIGKNPNIRIKLVTESDDLAKKILSAVSDTLLYNDKFKEIFPHIEKSKSRGWNTKNITVERQINHRDPTIEAAGVMSAKTGGRADLICYDKETEILTENGWKLFKDLNRDEKVATLNKDGYLEYQYPSNYISYKYTGKMYCYDGEQINFKVTPHHNMYVGRIVGKNKPKKEKMSLVPIEDIYGKGRIYFKKDCLWRGIFLPYITIPSYKKEWLTPTNGYRCKIENEKNIDSSVFMKFLGIFLAEGNVYFKYGRPCGISIGQKEGDSYNKIISVLKNLPFDLKIYTSYMKDGKKFYEIKINSVQLGDYMLQFGHGACNKLIPKWIRELNSELLSNLYEYFKIGDGWSNGIGTSSKLLSEHFQEIALKIGFVLRENILNESYMISPLNGNRYKTKKFYTLTENITKLLPDFRYGSQNYKWSIEQYMDYVYCVSVPNKIIYIRRKGASFWCGNCFDDIAGMRNTLIYPKNKEMVKESVFSNWMPMLVPDSHRWYLIGTPWHIKDIVSDMRLNKQIPRPKEAVVGPNFESPWPARFSNDYYKKQLEQLGRRHYNRAYRLIPMSDDEAWLNKGAIEAAKRFNLDMQEVARDKNIPKFTGVDIGHRSGPDQCPTVVFTIALLDNGTRIPCDIRVSHEANPLDIARLVISVAHDLDSILVMVENNGVQQWLIDMIKEIGPGDIKLDGYYTSNKKADPTEGLPTLLAEIESGKWLIPLSGQEHGPACLCNLCLWMNETIDFPNFTTDTTMASFMALQALKKIKERANLGGGFGIWRWEL